jgi:hypothetical protein
MTLAGAVTVFAEPGAEGALFAALFEGAGAVVAEGFLGLAVGVLLGAVDDFGAGAAKELCVARALTSPTPRAKCVK